MPKLYKQCDFVEHVLSFRKSEIWVCGGAYVVKVPLKTWGIRSLMSFYS